jgi:hypothetical protein
LTPLPSPRAFAAGILCMIALWLGGALPTAACSIDGIPSLAMNGKLVTINYGQATKDNFAYWAAFSLGSAPAGMQVRLAEDLPKVRQALSAEAMRTPFSWSFGDGDAARGASVLHTYSQPGWYKVDVRYYLPEKRQWLIFDSAQVRIAPPASAGAVTGHGAMIWLSGTSLAVIAIAAGMMVQARRRKRVPAPAGRAARGATRTGHRKRR